MSFKPENTEAFKAIFETNWTAIRSFDGCSHVELLQDEHHPHVFFTYSIWTSEAHLNRYRESELFQAVWGATKLLFNDKPQAWSVKQLQFPT